MNAKTTVAEFITARIEATGQLQKDIAEKAGFDKPNIITMIKQGKTRLPLDKVGPVAMALETDPLQLLQMCLAEYHPATWESIAPFMSRALSRDEWKIVEALRSSAGVPYLSAIDENARNHLESFLRSLQERPAID